MRASPGASLERQGRTGSYDQGTSRAQRLPERYTVRLQAGDVLRMRESVGGHLSDHRWRGGSRSGGSTQSLQPEVDAPVGAAWRRLDLDPGDLIPPVVVAGVAIQQMRPSYVLRALCLAGKASEVRIDAA